MYNAATLLDIHTRAHESLRRLIVFCGNLTNDELRRPLTGFGFPTVLRQLEHTIGAEVYWHTVVTTGYTEEATLPKLQDVAAIGGNDRIEVEVGVDENRDNRDQDYTDCGTTDL